MRIALLKWPLVLSLFVLQGCAFDTVPYLYRLAVHQARLLSKRQPIEQILKNPDSGLSPEFKRRLSLTSEIRAFARRIGLTPGGAYTRYAPLELKLYVITAAERTRLKRREWWWPIVGSLPYKGYFSREGVVREVQKLRALRMDTHVRTVRAYSTLGWFDDPVVPGMLRGSLGRFAGVIIHESVHDTFFRKDNAAFNEQAAVLVERAGALRFLREKFGGRSKELGRYRKALDKGERFLRIVDALYADLSRLYGSNLSDAEKLSRREEIFRKYLSAHRRIRDRLLAERRSVGLSVKLNNAYVLAYRLCFENRDRLKEIFHRIGRDLPKMVRILRQAAEAEGDPYEALDRLAGVSGSRSPR